MSRLVACTITDPRGRACEGYLLALWGDIPVMAATDASGVAVLDLESMADYRLAVETTIALDGVTTMAGTVLLVTVPEGDEPITLGECIVETVDASPIAQLDRIAALEALVAPLDGGDA